MHTHTLPPLARPVAPGRSAPRVVEAPRGVAYFRRGAWAAFLHTGALVGQFATSREAFAALGGAA